jgi:hypothetical protein
MTALATGSEQLLGIDALLFSYKLTPVLPMGCQVFAMQAWQPAVPIRRPMKPVSHAQQKKKSQTCRTVCR